MNMMDVRSLYVTYLSEEERVEAVRGIDFSAEEGKVTGIVGESGSGKSTAMLAVMGLLDHKAAVEAEKVSLFGNTVRAGDNAAIIFQDPLKCLNPTVKIGRQIAETVRNRKKCTWREAKKRSEELLDSVGIRHPRLRMKQYPFELSGGQKKRVAIAGVLAMNPKILILDEPTAGLDPKGRDDILDQIAELHKVRGITIVLVSHSMEDIAKYVERLIVMNHGEAVFDDEPKKVFSHYKELETMGLAAPQITYIMHALKEHGLHVDADATTVEEARDSSLAALAQANSPLLNKGAAEK